MGLLGLGFISVLLSDPVLSGFLLAASILIPTSQLKRAFDVEISPESLWGDQIYNVFEAVGEGKARWTSFAIFAVCAVFLVICRHLNKNTKYFKKFPIPGELITVVLATLVAYAYDLKEAENISVLGHFQEGFPPIGVPKFDSLSSSDLGSLLWRSCIITLITFLTASSIGKTFARKHKYPYDPNQELIAFGVLRTLF